MTAIPPPTSEVSRLLQKTSASGVLDRQLRTQHRKWQQVLDYGEFRDRVLGRVWERQATFKGTTPEEFLAWLRRIGWSLAVDAWREKKRQVNLLTSFARLLPKFAPFGGGPTGNAGSRSVVARRSFRSRTAGSGSQVFSRPIHGPDCPSGPNDTRRSIAAPLPGDRQVAGGAEKNGNGALNRLVGKRPYLEGVKPLPEESLKLVLAAPKEILMTADSPKLPSTNSTSTPPEEGIPNAGPPTYLLDLTEAYLELIDRHGLNSAAVKNFQKQHAADPEIADWITADQELRTSARLARRGVWVIRFAWGVSLLLVVGVVALAIYRGQELAASLWGWQDPGGFSASRPVCCQLFAEVRRRARQRVVCPKAGGSPGLGQTSGGVSLRLYSLLLAEHQPLTAEDKRWLLEKCRLWADHCEDSVSRIRNQIDPHFGHPNQGR